MNRDYVIEQISSLIGAELLSQAYLKDELANGVQIHGKIEVSKIALGVSCNADFLEQAISWGADMCIFHHGFDVRADRSIYSVSSQKRLQLIFQHQLTIAAYHYTLDAHPILGNNAQIIQRLGGKIVDTLFEDWGFVTVLKAPKTLKKLKQDCESLFDHEVLAVGDLDREVQRLGIVSGAAKPYSHHIKEMHDKKVELFITGESSESIPYKMKDEDIAYFAGGHYATEVFGVKALGEALQQEFGVEVEVKFVDVPNSI